jgi:hypothetical protein
MIFNRFEYLKKILMKKLLLLTFITSLLSVMSFAQSSIWVVGNRRVEFSFANPLPIGPNSSIDYAGQQANASANAYHNPVSGELLFFIVDGIIYDKDGYIIDDLIANSASGENILGFAETVIVPDPVYEDKTLY